MSRLRLVMVVVLVPVFVTVSGSHADTTTTTTTSTTTTSTTSTTTTTVPEPSVSVSSNPEITLVGADERDTKLVERVLGYYVEAGLKLPVVTIEFQERGSGCKGFAGFFRGSEWLVALCNRSESVLTHELAHAWAAANLTDADKEAFMAYIGAEAWNDGEDDHDERGTEQVAYAIQHALVTFMAGGGGIYASEKAHTVAFRFEMLTGQPAPFGVTGTAEADPSARLSKR